MSITGVRTRAWILVQAESPYEAAKSLYDAQKDKGDDRYVLVRADVVDYVYNMVIPVDAESWDALQEAYHMIQETTKAKYSTIIPVLKHFPFPAHDAHSFITADEVAAGHWKDIIPGRQHWSPGENAWG
jgi:hypothetical protein